MRGLSAPEHRLNGPLGQALSINEFWPLNKHVILQPGWGPCRGAVGHCRGDSGLTPRWPQSSPQAGSTLFPGGRNQVLSRHSLLCVRGSRCLESRSSRDMWLFFPRLSFSFSGNPPSAPIPYYSLSSQYTSLSEIPLFVYLFTVCPLHAPHPNTIKCKLCFTALSPAPRAVRT